MSRVITITPDALVAMGCQRGKATAFAGSLTSVANRYAINTPLRVSHFLAQVLHESGRLRYVEEIASGVAYEGREDLGNIQPGDGRRFKGRGLIQLTGRANYERYSKATGIDFVSNPEKVAMLPHCVDVAGWYWQIRDLNRYADMDDLWAITKRVNGGLNGIKDRAAILTLARAQMAALARRAEPAPAPVPPPEPEELSADERRTRYVPGLSKAPVLPPDPLPGEDPISTPGPRNE